MSGGLEVWRPGGARSLEHDPVMLIPHVNSSINSGFSSARPFIQLPGAYNRAMLPENSGLCIEVLFIL